MLGDLAFLDADMTLYTVMQQIVYVCVLVLVVDFNF